MVKNLFSTLFRNRRNTGKASHDKQHAKQAKRKLPQKIKFKVARKKTQPPKPVLKMRSIVNSSLIEDQGMFSSGFREQWEEEWEETMSQLEKMYPEFPDQRFFNDVYHFTGSDDQKIGSGGQGTVHLLHDDKLNKNIAMKVVHLIKKPSNVQSTKQKSKSVAKLQRTIMRIQNEIKFLKQFSEKKESVGFCGVWFSQRDHAVYISCELACGDLTSVNFMNMNPADKEKNLKCIAKSVISQLFRLHCAQWVHCDVKPANLLVQKGDVMLADYGLVAPVDDKGLMYAGTKLFQAPEIWNKRADLAGFSLDSYAFGISLLRMISDRSVYQTQEGFRPKQLSDPRGYSPEFDDFVKQCLKHQAGTRANAFQLLHHPWLRNAPEKLGAEATIASRSDPSVFSLACTISKQEPKLQSTAFGTVSVVVNDTLPNGVGKTEPTFLNTEETKPGKPWHMSIEYV